MSDKKHTKGPWIAGRPDMATIVDGYDSKWIYTGSQTEELKYVAVASGQDIDDWEEVMANAHLIAAAPELLEALEGCCLLVYGAKDDYCHTEQSLIKDGECGNAEHCHIWNAIQKARGKQ